MDTLLDPRMSNRYGELYTPSSLLYFPFAIEEKNISIFKTKKTILICKNIVISWFNNTCMQARIVCEVDEKGITRSGH